MGVNPEDTAAPAAEACAEIVKLASSLLSLRTTERPLKVCPFTEATVFALGAILLAATRGAENLIEAQQLTRSRHGLAHLFGNIE